MFASLVVYFGFVLAAAGLVSVMRPLRLIGVPTRKAGALLAVTGALVAIIGISLPARERRGTPELYRSIKREGFILATMNFLVRPDPQGGSRVSTETRVFATSAAVRRRFAVYWRAIYPGSAIIRRMWLRAIKRRAEA